MIIILICHFQRSLTLLSSSSISFSSLFTSHTSSTQTNEGHLYPTKPKPPTDPRPTAVSTATNTDNRRLIKSSPYGKKTRFLIEVLYISLFDTLLLILAIFIENSFSVSLISNYCMSHNSHMCRFFVLNDRFTPRGTRSDGRQ